MCRGGSHRLFAVKVGLVFGNEGLVAEFCTRSWLRVDVAKNKMQFYPGKYP